VLLKDVCDPLVIHFERLTVVRVVGWWRCWPMVERIGGDLRSSHHRVGRPIPIRGRVLLRALRRRVTGYAPGHGQVEGTRHRGAR
jgi:hypothetical protein